MGYSRRRVGVSGRARYTAYYWDVRGRERSAGTFDRVRDAERAWRRAEAHVAEGRFTDVRSGRQSFEHYVTITWLPGHLIEANTRQAYTRVVERYLLQEFGRMRMNEILPRHVREFIRRLCDEGMSAHTVQRCRTVLGAIFTTALRDDIVFQHPCASVKGPPVPPVPLHLLEPHELDAVLEALPSTRWRMLVEVAIETGVRWGELTELRVNDLDMPSRLLTVARTVTEVEPRFHPHGGRFLVKAYPKDREYRQLKLRRALVDRLAGFVRGFDLHAGDLLFTIPAERSPCHPTPADSARPMEIQSPHGTLACYSARRCRCAPCRGVYARYRAERRAHGKDRPARGRQLDTDGHIPRNWHLKHIWKPALATAGITRRIRMHDLRHAHASWLLAGGANIQTVRERLGHSSLRATEKYLHTLASSDDDALLARVSEIP